MPSSREQPAEPDQTTLATVASYLCDRVKGLASRAAADGGVSAALLLLKVTEDEAADDPVADAAAGCIPGLVAALASAEEVVWKAALRVLGLAALSSADSRQAIAAAGGLPAAARLAQANSSDSCAVQFACGILGPLALHGAETCQLVANSDGIPALVSALAAADSVTPSVMVTDIDGFATALAAVVHYVPSSARQVVAAGGVKPLLQLCTSRPAGSIARRSAEKVLEDIADHCDGGWSAIQVAAAHEAAMLPPDTQRTLLELICKVRSPPAEQQQAARSRRHRPQAAAPTQPLDPAQLAASELAARAAADALLQEEEQQAAQQAAKAASKSAKRQRQRERQQAAAQAAATVEAAASSTAAAAIAAPEQPAEVAAAPASGSAAAAAHGVQAADGVQQEGTGSAGGSGHAGRSKKQRKRKGKKAAAGAAAGGEQQAAISSGPAGPHAAGSSGAAAFQQASAAADSSAAPAEPDAAELEQLMQQLGLGASAQDSAHSGGGTSTAIMSAMPPAAWPVAPPAAATAAPAPSSPFDPSLLSDLCCPITHEPMTDPVVAADGGTYERAAIEAWIAQQRAAGQAPTSPLTGATLQDLSLRPNLMARGLVASLRVAGLLQ